MSPSRGRRPRAYGCGSGRPQASRTWAVLVLIRETTASAADTSSCILRLVALPSGESDAKRQRRNVEEPPVGPAIERNRQAIANGSDSNVASSRVISREEKKWRVSIVQQLATDLNIYKQELGSGRSKQY